MGYHITYSDSSGEKALRKTLLIGIIILLFILGFVWKQQILMFLLFPGKEEIGERFFSEAAAGIQSGTGIIQSIVLAMQSCRNG